MKLNISKNELVAALAIVSKATSNRSTIPILSGILIRATDGEIDLFSTDLETSIKTSAAGLIEEEGSVVVPAKIITDIVRSLPDVSILLETIGQSLSIKAHQSSFTIRTLPAEDFVKFPEIEGVESITLPAGELAEMTKKVARVVGRDETRAVLTGILLQIDKNTIKMVATDSYRLAIVEKEREATEGAEQFEALIPGKALDDVVKMADKSANIEITLTTNQVRFIFGSTTFITRRIEGTYPNYQNLLPDEYALKVVLSTEEMTEAAKRAALMAANNTALKMSVSVEDQALIMTAQSTDQGQAEEVIMAKAVGEDREISANPTYLLDGLSVVPDEFITLELQEAMKPGIIRSEEGGYLYLFMPVRPN
ncbi:MAG: DNA polymerase III subunit beta [Coriobacteriia bacterium]|nr:DNA polymerase III subunit beta [Coriobacteriia bacterium]